MAIKFLSGQTISGTLTVSGNVQGATFNGLAINTTGTNNVANQIVRTQANGYVNFGWINSVSGNHTGSITRITASNDAYLRYVTPAQFRTGVTDGFYAPSSTVSGVTSVATTNGISGGTITSTGTIQVDSTVIRTTGTQSITGNTSFYPSSTGTGYSTAAIELRSSSSGLSGTPPRIGFHWDSVVASNIAIESNGTIVIRDNPGTGYEDLKALNITATGVVYASGGNSGTWNSHTSNTGTVTSVATGSGLTGGTITTTGTLSLDRPNSQLGAVLATYGTTAGASGRVRCTAPFNTNSSKMFSIEVTLYTSYTQHNYVVSAYMYSTTNQWYSPKAIYTTTGTASPDIYVGRDGNGKAYISIANSAYTGVLVHNMTRGYTTSLANTYEPWTITIDGGNENSTSVAVSTVYTSANLPAYPSVGNGQIDGRTSGLGISGSMDATANQTGNTTFTVTSNAVEAATASTLVYRNSSADINVRLLRANYQDQGTISGAIAYRVNNSSDNYTRYCSSPSAIRTFLGVPASGDLGNYLPLAGGTMTGSISMGTQNFAVAANYGRGVYGLYNASRLQHMWSMGTAYNLADNGTSAGNLYGMAWSHPNAGGVAANLSNHGELLLLNGTYQAAISGSIRCITDMRTPIYYDSNNTGYFLDPAGNYSNLSKIKISANWGTPTGVSPDDAQLQIRGTYPSITFRSTNSNKMWLRHMDSAGQIQHYYAAGTDSTSWSIKHTMKIDGTFESQGSMHAPIFYDLNNTAYYGDFASTSVMSRINVGNGNNPAIQIAPNSSYGAGTELEIGGWSTSTSVSKIRNSNGNLHIDSKNGHNMYLNHYPPGNILVGNGGGYLLAYQSMRSPIFYDSNNTGYYLDPASTSNLNVVTAVQFNGTVTNAINLTGPGGSIIKSTSTGVSYQNNYQIRENTGGSGNTSEIYAPQLAFHWGGVVASSIMCEASGRIAIRDNPGTGYEDFIASICNSTESSRAPIFYDRDNTAFYVDPASTSKFNDIWSTDGGNNTTAPRWDTSFYVAQSQHYYGHSSTQTMYLGESNTINIRSIGVASGSLRAPIFYDSNNTGYYLDPASTSQLNVLNCAGTLTVTGAGGVIAPKFTDYNNGSFYLDPSSTGTSLNVAGDVVAYASSDIRFKNNITPITNALDKLSKIGGYTFEWNEISHKETGKKDIGVVAQEVEEILPEIVDTRDNGYKAVDYSKLTALLIQSVKEQQVIINDLKTRIETLENN